MPSSPSRNGLVAAGLLTWLVAVGPGAAGVLRGDLDGAAAWGAAAVGFVAAFLFGVTRGPSDHRARAGATLLQIVAALVLVVLDRDGLPAALLVVTAGQLPFFLGVRAATAWLGLQATGLLAIAVAAPQTLDPLAALGYCGFQIFATTAALLAQRERSARAELTRTHAELLAMQELLADTTRSDERLRIARDLHDSIGHHLAALGIHLELARQVASGAAVEPIARCHSLARQLQAEVREVVGEMREDRPLDLASALRTLVSGVPAPRIHLTIGEEVAVLEPSVAHALFRCVQEGLTNAIRHARAAELWIDLASDARGRIEMTIRDDGIGAERLAPGVGLTGLRERVEALGGRLSVDAGAGRGVRLYARVPDRVEEAA